jgi:light-regulated signal transduction histidine kinase (bacteriophytochrome)
MRILVVEDAPVSRRLLQRCLQKWGHDVVVASNGAEAWQRFTEGDFRIVISDWTMPGMDGPEFIRRIRASPRPGYVYTVLLTAKSEKEDIVTGMDAGADDFVIKPFDQDELRVRLRAGERIVQLEQTLAEQNQELRARAEEMEAFAHSASHDLQTPLRTFEGYARWLLEDYGEVLGAQGRELCDEIIEDALHMKTLLDGLLEYSRISCLEIEPALVPVQRVVERTLHDLQAEIAATGAHIDLPETLPAVLYSDVCLTQVFSHLVSNALKFIDGKPPVITIGCEDYPECYRITVSDHGIGIAPEHHRRIFELFKRLHTRDAYPGTGAGLTFVKRIVETHGGQVGVESKLGEGSTFFFTIPKTPPLGLHCAQADASEGS